MRILSNRSQCGDELKGKPGHRSVWSTLGNRCGDSLGLEHPPGNVRREQKLRDPVKSRNELLGLFGCSHLPK